MSSSGLLMLLLNVSAIWTYISVVLMLLCPISSFTILEVDALLNQMGGEGVAQQVGIDPLGDAGLLRGGFQPFRHYALGELLTGVRSKSQTSGL